MNFAILAVKDGINGAFDYIFSYWQIALFVLLAVLLLLTILFKGLKKSVKVLVICAVAVGAVFLAGVIYQMITWELTDLIDFAVRWAPTIIFVLIIFIAALFGLWRGLRKSLVLLLHSVIAAAVALTLYFTLVNSYNLDKWMVSAANVFMGEYGLQDALGVSRGCETLRDVFVEFIPTVLDGQWAMLVSENSAYLYTLVDMAFRIVYATLCFIIYFTIVFTLYLVYLLCYSERKRKRRINDEFANGLSDCSYRKRHIGGGVVGVCRGLVAGVVTMSFLGGAMYIVAGGKGEGKLSDYDFDNETADFSYSVYRSIESYGAQGILKVLNMMTDAEDTPYYLFAADLIFSGELDDEEYGISGNINFREELGAYTGFARDTFQLLMKYGEDDLKPILNGGETADAMSTIVDVMTAPGFQTEFDDLIEEFDQQTYIINLSMSFVDSVVANIDETSFASSISEDNRDMMKLLFKKGYLSDVIPDERELKAENGGGLAEGDDIRPCISVKQIVDKKDVQRLLRVVLSFFSEEGQERSTLETTQAVLADLQGFSLLNGSKDNTVNPVLGRLYCYIENKYLTVEGEYGIDYAELVKKDIPWVSEIYSLIDVVQELLLLGKNVYVVGGKPLDIVLSIFDENNAHYSENISLYDSVTEAVTDSLLLGETLSTSYVFTQLKETLSSVSPEIYLPKDLVYENVYEGGEVVYGETYQLLHGLRFLGEKGNREILELLTNADAENVTDALKIIADRITVQDQYGNTLSDYFTESGILRSVLSITLIEQETDTLYVPTVSLDSVDGAPVNMINKRELKQLLDNVTALVDFSTPFVDGSYLETVDDFIRDDTFYKLVQENRIFEGSVAKLLSIQMAGNSSIIVPAALINDIEGWVTTEDGQGELRNLLDSLRATEFRLADVLQGEVENSAILDSILSLSPAQLKVFLDSDVLHYTVSDYLLKEDSAVGGITVIVPYSVKKALSDDVLEYVIKRDELLNLFGEISEFGISGDATPSQILVKLAVKKDALQRSRIISTSAVYSLVHNDEVCSLLSLNESFIAAGSREQLENFNSANVWYRELPSLIDALDEILHLSSADENFVLDEQVMDDAVSELLRTLNDDSTVNPRRTKLRVCYDSQVIRNNMTVRLDGIFLDGGIVGENVIREAKEGGYYKYAELQSLSDALDIFNLDVLNLDGDELTAAVKGKIFELNEPLDEYDGRSALNVVYPSVIISHMFSAELDKALGEDLIDQTVLAQIKRGSVRYAESEIASFVDAGRELGITDADELSGIDFSDIASFNGTSDIDPERSKLSVICSSRIAGGIITRSLQNTIAANEALYDHPRAYRTDIDIYKLQEIESLASIADGADLENLQIDVSKVRGYILDGDGNTSSYLMTAAVSKQLLQNDGLIIPKSVMDGEFIRPDEVVPVLDVYIALKDDENYNDIENWELDLKIPDAEIRDVMFSSLILRTRITYEIGLTENVFGAKDAVSIITDVDGIRRSVLNAEEMYVLADALEIVNADGAFRIPEFTLEQIGNDYSAEDLEVLFRSSVIRYKLCDCVLENAAVNAILDQYGITPHDESAINLRSLAEVNKKVIYYDELLLVLGKY